MNEKNITSKNCNSMIFSKSKIIDVVFIPKIWKCSFTNLLEDCAKYKISVPVETNQFAQYPYSGIWLLKKDMIDNAYLV